LSAALLVVEQAPQWAPASGQALVWRVRRHRLAVGSSFRRRPC
jgi:hypothetical protein